MIANIQPYGFNSYKSRYLPNFQGDLLSKAMKVIPDTKVCKNLTKLDKTVFNIYVNSRQYKMGITPEEIEALSKFDGNDLIINSYIFIAEKMGLPASLRPDLRFMPIDSEILMGYSNMDNIIYIDSDKIFSQKNINKARIFSSVRHELQHFMQNADILRHETIGEHAVEVITAKYVDLKQQQSKYLLQNMSIEQLEAEGMFPDKKSKDRFVALKKCLDNNDNDGFNDLFVELGQQYKSSLNNLRQQIILKMGTIKQDSSLTPKIKNYFNEFMNIKYYNVDGSVKCNEYYDTLTEAEAIESQLFAEFEFLQQPCFMKYQKDSMLKFVDSEEAKNFVDKLKKS